LLLAHANTQKTNQTRLENYLAASTSPNLNIAERLQAVPKGRRSPMKSGTDTPRDLNARVKILELYTLHVLLRNNEWDYSREFITMSEVLDEERREAFLQALQSLQDEQLDAERREREERRYQEEMLKREIEEQRRKREQEERERKLQEEKRDSRKSSEVDYGVEDSYPSSGSAKPRSVKGGSAKGSRNRPQSPPPTTRSSKPQKPVRKGKVEPTLGTRAANILANLKKALESMAGALSTNPMLLLRTLCFMVAFLVLFGRRDVRERIRRAANQGWTKVLQTAGMGVKVSYI